jgi:hypothetical protein
MMDSRLFEMDENRKTEREGGTTISQYGKTESSE